MASRTLPANTSIGTWGQPIAGAKTKNVTVQGPYNGQQSSAATSDTIVVYADYGLQDTTAVGAVDVNSTNLKDPA